MIWKHTPSDFITLKTGRLILMILKILNVLVCQTGQSLPVLHPNTAHFSPPCPALQQPSSHGLPRLSPHSQLSFRKGKQSNMHNMDIAKIYSIFHQILYPSICCNPSLQYNRRKLIRGYYTNGIQQQKNNPVHLIKSVVLELISIQKYSWGTQSLNKSRISQAELLIGNISGVRN